MFFCLLFLRVCYCLFVCLLPVFVCSLFYYSLCSDFHLVLVFRTFLLYSLSLFLFFWTWSRVRKLGPWFRNRSGKPSLSVQEHKPNGIKHINQDTAERLFLVVGVGNSISWIFPFQPLDAGIFIRFAEPLINLLEP